MKHPSAVVMVIALAAMLAVPAFAEKRVALVIGNGAYKTSTTLKNPPADAADVSVALKSAGFTVTTLIDAKRETMEKAVRNFGNMLKDPDAVGLFYYSGHGAQVDGANYLLPVDADIQAQDELAYKAVNAEQVLAKMRSAGNRLNIVVLDACRNNPFPGSTRSADKGLAVVGVKVPESIIVYATDPGAVALDGDGRNSPFTKAFIAQLAVPGQEISVALRRVTGEVKDVTRGAQTPWISTNYTRDFAFRPSGGGSVAVTPALSPAAPSKTPSFGAVQAATGNLSITLATAGTVTVAGLSAVVPAGTVPVNDLAAGSQTVTVRYADGKSESRTVTVPAGGTATVAFAYTPAASTQTVPSSGAPGHAYRNEVWIPGGSFQMGSTDGDSDEKPVHTVTVSGFWMMKTEVTMGDFRDMIDSTGYRTTAEREGAGYVYTGSQWQMKAGASWKNQYFNQADNNAVTLVSWYDAVAYANALSKKDGLSPAYTINGTSVTLNQSASGWRLPTEAQWEYAAKGGPKASAVPVQAKWAGSADIGSVAWYKDNSGSTTHPVGTKAANAAGLYDMAGNVWEWCQDWYASYVGDSQTNPAGAVSVGKRVFRGGSWLDGASLARSTLRRSSTPDYRHDLIGFRLVRPPVR
ncbi:MAG: SUMF1/EgtB/PvdO family nonheme iron enzyme [Spirochaetales bacterium]|nr:SUMF1/EgtB/PvdO family nonheme iron enzyme [Spirochaetales bacterium]